MSKTENTLLGAGEVYMYEFTGESIPEDTEIETAANNVGDCSGGFEVEYKPKKYDIKNQYNKIVKSVITEEDINVKTGILTWNLKNLAMLSTANITLDTSKSKRILTFGSGNALKTVLFRFVHTKDNGKKIRFTSIMQGGNGFKLEFGASKETTVDAELQAISAIKNFLAQIDEELTEEELKALQSQA